MKGHLKRSILAILTLLVTIGLVFAQPVPIGADRQPNPFESNPSTHTATAMGTVTTPSNMWDGDLLSSSDFSIGSGFFTSGNLVVKGFDVPANPFAIGWVDLKIKYHVPLPTTDDTYRIEYTTDGVTWIVLLPDTGEAFDVAGGPPPIRPFSQITPSGGGAWTWNDIANLQVRVWATRGGFAWDGKKMWIYEVWATVYPLPLPPTASPTISIQPSMVTTGPSGAFTPNYFFVDVYVMDMANMLGFETVITFDPGVIQGIMAFSYYPFKSEVFPPAIDNVAGYVSLAYYTFGGDNVGFTGNTPIARIYFAVNGPALGLPPPTADETSLRFDVHKITDVFGGVIAHTAHDGLFRIPHYLSATDATLSPIIIDPANPIGTHWHEIYPTYSEEYDLTSWEDNGDGVLSASDQIDMFKVSTGTTDWYHVEEVTITIWWTVKTGDPYGWDGMTMSAEPEMPTYELLTDPIGSKWHQIYPPDFYSLTFTITSWEDSNSDGYFTPSDQFDFEYDFDPGVQHWAHLDAMSTDMIVTPKPPPVPEFPLGLSVIMLLAPIIPLAYLWRLKKRVSEQ